LLVFAGILLNTTAEKKITLMKKNNNLSIIEILNACLIEIEYIKVAILNINKHPSNRKYIILFVSCLSMTKTVAKVKIMDV
jgi:hypothetical protein